MKTSLFWFRRDLRLYDNAGLYQALKNEESVQCLFIFDKDILNRLEDKKDKRLVFIHHYLEKIKRELENVGASLLVKYGKPLAVFKELSEEFDIKALYANRDYEPYARERDKAIYTFFKQKNIPFHGFKDHVIFEKGEIVKEDGSPYTVYTPYGKKWKMAFAQNEPQSFPSQDYFSSFRKTAVYPFLTLKDIGFEYIDVDIPEEKPADEILENYHQTRDYPAVNGTSRLSVHLRFGTVSIREWVKRANETNEKFLNELIWREFYQMTLYHFPESVTKAIKPAYDRIEWENNEVHFAAWCAGKTGYPLVDAGMRELNESGYMHNRVRMLVASFLTKHLLIDWRWGERYFAQKLLDFELASNVGGWQWAAGCGNDAAPYFRIFNPEIQLEKFDAERKYVKKWIPEYGTKNYPEPIVNHREARERALERYGKM